MNLKNVIPSFVLGALFLVGCGDIENDSQIDVLKAKQTSGFDLPQKTLALTFDDGPGLGTKEFARWLKSQNVPATFFVVGSVAKNNLSALATIRDNGHLVANHSTSHPINPPFVQLSAARRLAEIRDTDKIIKPYITGSMFLFRAPGGSWSERSATIADVPDLRKYVGPVFWDVGGELTATHAADYACWAKNISVSDCGQRYINEITGRKNQNGVVLMHDIHDRTIQMVRQVILPRLKAAGYKFVRLDKVPNISKELKANGGKPGT